MASECVADAQEIKIDVGRVQLQGTLTLPPAARALVVFAHGSGSSRHSPRNRRVADYLNEHHLATLLFDLLTANEEAVDADTAELRFDIELLARRLAGTVNWLGRQPNLARYPLGLFGASTGAAGALRVAAEYPRRIQAVVSRGGRPDLAGSALPRVQAPTLLIVGGQDAPVLRLNQEAARRLSAPHEIRTISGATHLFEEPGALDQVAELAAQWFQRHLCS
jgi:dienelactone hydrolase